MEARRQPTASFPLELIDPISNYLLADDVVDYIRFRAVCRDWRSRTASPCTFASQFRPHRWIMRLKYQSDFSSPCHFHNHFTRKDFSFHLPELGSHFIISAFDGLLLVEDDTYIMRLFNPFTRRMSDALPPLLPDFGFSYNLIDEYKERARDYMITADDSPCPTIMFYIPNRYHDFAKPGDTRWQCIDFNYVDAVGNFKGKFYYVSPKHGIGLMEPEKMLVTPLLPLQYGDSVATTLLLKFGSDLFLMLTGVTRFDLFKVDLECNTLVKIGNLWPLLLSCYGQPVLVP